MTVPPGFYPIPHHPVVKSLPSAAKDLLGLLYWHRNSVTGQCNPRHQTLARELQWSYWKVQTYIRVLREAWILRATKSRRGNQYEIRPQEEWRAPERKAWASATPCLGESTYVKTHRQDDFILNEQEAILLKERAVAALPTLGGGDPPAAVPEKTEDERPEAPRTAAPPPPPVMVRKETHQLPILPPAKREEPAAEVSDLAGQLVAAAPGPSDAGEPSRRRASDRESAIRRRHRGGDPAEPSAVPKTLAGLHQGRFIPMLARWIGDNDWRFPPEERQIIANRDPDWEDPVLRERRLEEEAKRSAERKVVDAVAKAKRERREELEAIELILSGRMVWPTPTPEMIEIARQRRIEIEREAA